MLLYVLILLIIQSAMNGIPESEDETDQLIVAWFRETTDGPRNPDTDRSQIIQLIRQNAALLNEAISSRLTDGQIWQTLRYIRERSPHSLRSWSNVRLWQSIVCSDGRLLLPNSTSLEPRVSHTERRRGNRPTFKKRL